MLLDATFAVGIGHRRTWDWSPGSCDITPCDFSMCGIIKDKRVFKEKPFNIDFFNIVIWEYF